MNGIIEVLKTNKKAIIKKALLLAGVAVGLGLVVQATNNGAEEPEEADYYDVDGTEVDNSGIPSDM